MKKFLFAFLCIALALSMYININIIRTSKSDTSPNKPLRYGEVDKKGEYVSMINLIATPEKYDNTLVNLYGVAEIKDYNDEDISSIYLTKDDYKNSVTKDSLLMILNYKSLKTDNKELSKFNGKSVRIIGTFKKNYKGMWGLCSGGIDNIKFIMYNKNSIPSEK